LKSDSKASVQAKMEYLAAWQKTSQQVAALKTRLQSAPTDAATRAELVKTLLVDLDNPAAAAKFVDTSLDATLQKFVPAAAKGVEQTPELACKELGD
jgi:thioredoxin-like negative regulator of GroEL